MLKRRLIPVLYLKDGWMVRSQDFALHQFIGEPVAHVERMIQWDVDELIILDIGAEDSVFDHHRNDYRYPPVMTMLEFIERTSIQCNIPLTFGGRIRSVADIGLRIRNGADKVTVNSMLYTDAEGVEAATREFGSQAIVASIDYRTVEGAPQVFFGRGNRPTDLDPVIAARKAEALGVGEILLNSMDQDGSARGYDVDTVRSVADAVSIPVVACGGAGDKQHFLDVLQQTEASAAAAGNIFHFKENAYPQAKRFLRSQLDDIR
ncbi:MAG: imidazole glycerol phosphate synthase cyclase subunit [Hoeflea sp.]|uniref:imidazole glycerol phosphate synthase subunit HisF n=1 Tax=Hoeflea sp. TaxID=1940281 RepID=UPI0032983563